MLWVAQTDELCEQAVQSFRQVWSNCGKDWTELRIVRLWGGNPDPTPSADDVPTTVVATIQTLTSRLGKDRLAFLKDCALVVIDESHHAITTSYTQLLDWFLPEEPTGRCRRTHASCHRPYGYAVSRHERGRDAVARQPVWADRVAPRGEAA